MELPNRSPDNGAEKKLHGAEHRGGRTRPPGKGFARSRQRVRRHGIELALMNKERHDKSDQTQRAGHSRNH